MALDEVPLGGRTVLIRPVEAEQIRHLAGRAARERVSLAPTKNPTLWWGALLGNELVGVSGCMLTKGHARLKGQWIEPDMRGCGLGHRMTLTVMRHLDLELGVRSLEAYSVNPRYYESLGFSRVRELRHGVFIVRRTGRPWDYTERET